VPLKCPKNLEACALLARFSGLAADLCSRGIYLAFRLVSGWLSRRKRRLAKALYLKRVPRVRIPPHPIIVDYQELTVCRELERVRSHTGSHTAQDMFENTQVIERLRASSVAAPAQFSQSLKLLETEPEPQESFTLDLFRLLGDEGGFDWPVDDLRRCLCTRVEDLIGR
jgi:hypothetical protein